MRGGSVARPIRSYTMVTDAGCFESTRARKARPFIRFQGEKVRLARVVAHHFHGLDLTDTTKEACHHCDNKLCYRPSHIYVGTYSVNLEDAWKRGRRRKS